MPSVMLTNGTFGVSCGLVRFSFVAKVVTKFIPPMLCERLTNVSRLADRGYIAEPKLDGRRAQLHVHEGRAVACYSRRGLDLLEHAGMAWLKQIEWPFRSAVFDGEACAGDGHEGIQAVFTERKRVGGDMAVVLFDLLHIAGKSVMREPWRDRRKRLEQWEIEAARVSRGSVAGSIPLSNAPSDNWGSLAETSRASCLSTPSLQRGRTKQLNEQCPELGFRVL